MNDAVSRLVATYRQEELLYRELLRLAQVGAERVREGRPLTELNDLSERKRQCLAEIATLERSIAPEKEQWRREGKRGPQAGELQERLTTLTDLLERILDAERETDRWILEGAGLPPLPELVGQERVWG